MCIATTLSKLMPPTDPKPNPRSAILDAAETVVARDGASRLTIDAVVVESGYSKGGVLYHYPNKTALLAAMVDRMVEGISVEIDGAREQAEIRSEPILPAIIAAMVQHRKPNTNVSSALLAASAEQPELLDSARDYIEKIVADAVTPAPDPILGLIAFLAMDGLHFSDLLGLHYVSDEQREAVQSRLINMMTEMYA